MVTIYYGMSGSLKMTTMMYEKGTNDSLILSTIKNHIDFSKELLGRQPDDLEFGISRLLQLSTIDKNNGNYLIERGITDYLNAWMSRGNTLSDVEISRWTDKEMNLLSGNVVKRVLLNMTDYEFVDNIVLLDPHRRALYPDIDTYKQKQKEYIEFTKKFNRIDIEINIDNAESYIKNLKDKIWIV